MCCSLFTGVTTDRASCVAPVQGKLRSSEALRNSRNGFAVSGMKVTARTFREHRYVARCFLRTNIDILCLDLSVKGTWSYHVMGSGALSVRLSYFRVALLRPLPPRS